jgi:hypothetical protein
MPASGASYSGSISGAGLRSISPINGALRANLRVLRKRTLLTRLIARLRRPRLSRTIRTLLGAAIGLGAGAIVNATLGARFANEGRDITAVTLGGGAAIGAGIGAISGCGRDRLIYQRSTVAAK